MQSIWEPAALPSFPPLEGAVHTDVLIIGGGIAGILCALHLQQAGVDYVLIEADRIGRGVTARTTAKITAQHGLVYDALLRRFGPGGAKTYLQANLRALEHYRRLCRGIDCGFEPQDAFVYSLDDRPALLREQAALARIGYDAPLLDGLPLPFPAAGALRFAGQAQFDPLRFLAAVAAPLRIHEHTRALEYTGGTVRTSRGSVTARQIIVATHFPLWNKHGSYFLKLYQQRSYVLALEGADAPGGMYRDAAQSGLSFRRAGALLLLGGLSHRTGKPSPGWAPLEDFARRHWPGARPVARWATQDCVSLDGLPYVGRYSPRTPGLYVAAGFNKWGMTTAMAAAELLCGLVQGRSMPEQALFSPSRRILRPQLAANGVQALAGWLTPSARRCPHLGCALKWNPQEHSWDCPCHGSRFSSDGVLLDNPAEGDLPH